MSVNDERCLPTGKIVLVSDDEQARSLLCGFLAAHGYSGVIGTDSHGASAAESVRWDIAIVDTSVRYVETTRVLQRLRRTCAATVAIVARTNDAPHERAEGDDVLLGKPFDPRELLLIVRGLLDGEREGDGVAPATGSLVTAGPVTLAPLLNSASVAERELALTDVETRILHELMLDATRAVTRERLTRRALLRTWSPDDRALDTHINRLRHKLGRDRHGRTPLRTVTGVGYLLLDEWDPAR
jgi:DNA-binding response OmpR family regulator